MRIEFTDLYGSKKTEIWTREEQENVCRAAAYVQQVWSSKEFQNAVEAKSWKLTHGPWFKGFPTIYITGSALYKGLTGTPTITMRVSVANSSIVENYAVTLPSGSTAVRREYLDRTSDWECLKTATIIPCLTNTLSHEYTHYSASVASTDGFKSWVDDDDTVSYGIGDLTQRLAFPKAANKD